MARPGWYILDPGDLVVLPVQARNESPLRAIRQTGVYQETIRGESTNHPILFRRDLRPIFHVSVDQLDDYQALYDAVEGNTTAFYYVPDSAVLAGAIWVKLVNPDLDPTKLPKGSYGGVLKERYEIILEMIEQKAPVEILA